MIFKDGFFRIMAAGDTVGYFTNTSGAWVNFQPAAGTAFVITSCGGQGFNVGMTNGVADNAAQSFIAGGASTSVDQGTLNIKICIDNTNYLQAYPSSAPWSATGIQIK